MVITKSLTSVVDALGRLKADIAKLKREEGKLKAELIASGLSEIDGDLFRATVSNYESDIVDWKSVALYLKPSHQLIAGHTKVTPKTAVNVVALKTS